MIIYVNTSDIRGNMNIFITGGAGYIGSVLTRLLLSKNNNVRVLDNLLFDGEALTGVWSEPGFEFIRADIRDLEIVRKSLKNIDAVVHLAAIVGDPACSKNSDLASDVNLHGSLNLLEECKKQNISRFVFASTCSNYGKMDNSDSYVDENSELKPVSHYARTKVKVEKTIMNSEITKNVCATSLRFATVFGVSPRMRFDLVVNEFPKEMLIRKHLIVFGEQFWRPYIHVRDVGCAIMEVLNAPKEMVRNKAFNVGSSEQNFKKIQIVSMIQEHIPDARIEYVKKDEDPRDYRVNFSRFHNLFNFDTKINVKQGITEVIDLINQGIISDPDNPKYRNS